MAQTLARWRSEGLVQRQIVLQGCLEPRPASANQPLGPRWPARSAAWAALAGHIGCGFHMGTSSEGRKTESQLVIDLKLTTIALSTASVCARPLQTGSSVAVCASRLTPLGDCELRGERLGLAGEAGLAGRGRAGEECRSLGPGRRRDGLATGVRGAGCGSVGRAGRRRIGGWPAAAAFAPFDLAG